MAKQTQADNVSIEGTTTQHTNSQYGEDGCEKAMHVVIDGEDVYVPWDGVRPGMYDYGPTTEGEYPDEFDTDRIVVYDGHIHAEADVEDGVIEMKPPYNFATAEFEGYGSWESELFPADSVSDSEVVYERGDIDMGAEEGA